MCRPEYATNTVSATAGRVSIELRGVTVTGPGRVEAELRFVATVGSFRVRELPGRLGDNGKLVLICHELSNSGAITS